ncbi:MAG: hypothetical protein PWP23_17 [Candidatus Sumerlaeota bacterium]|nr:hypothetical protein [Candidatus Sumerlaeota bacterium]
MTLKRTIRWSAVLGAVGAVAVLSAQPGPRPDTGPRPRITQDPPQLPHVELLAIADELEARGDSDLAERLRSVLHEGLRFGPGMEESGRPGRGEGPQQADPGMLENMERDTFGSIGRKFLEFQMRLKEFNRRREAFADAQKQFESEVKAGKLTSSEAAKRRARLEEEHGKLREIKDKAANDFRDSVPTIQTRIEAWRQRSDDFEHSNPEAAKRVEAMRERLADLSEFLENLPEEDEALLQEVSERSERLIENLKTFAPGTPSYAPQRGRIAQDRIIRLQRETTALRQRLQHLDEELQAIQTDDPEFSLPDTMDLEPRTDDQRLPALPDTPRDTRR